MKKTLPIALALSLLVICAPLRADDKDKRVTGEQLLTKQVLELRARVNALEQQLVNVQPIVDAFTLQQQRASGTLKQEAQDIEQAWKTLEDDLRKTLKPKEGAVFNRETLGFTDKSK